MSNPASLKPFQKGDDPRRNMSGRPVGSRNLSTVLKDALQREVGAGESKKSLEDHVVDTVIKKALKGDFQMIKLIWAYRDGKPPKWKGNNESNTEPHKRKGLRNDDDELERVMKLFAPKDKPASTQ